MTMPTAITIAGIWIGAGIGARWSGDSSCCGAAMVATVAVAFFASLS